MALSTRPFLLVAAALLAALVGGCGSADGSRLNVVTIGDPDDPFEKGVRLSASGQLVRASVAEGLVAFDEQGRVIPALADRWIVTDDGQSYIFRLRDGTWRDGQELTARGAARSLRTAVDALRTTPLGLDLDGIEEIREMAGRVVEIRLSHPAPHLLQLLAQPELGLLHEGEGAGPMRLERVDDIALLTPIPPQELGLPEIKRWDERARSIALTSTSGEEAVRRFNAGETDLVLGGDLATFPHTASVGILRGTIQLDPVDGLFGLQVVTAQGFLAEPANRAALALALDRAALIAPFGVDGWKATANLVPASAEADIEGGVAERWAGLSLEERRGLASAQVARWRDGQAEDERAISLSLALPAGPGSDTLFALLRQHFSTIGVGVVRAASDKGADLRLLDVVARYPRAVWYLNRFNCKSARTLCSPDAALVAARRTADAAQRAAAIADAERLLTEANVFIPFGSPIRWSLVRGDAVGFASNAWGWHPLMPMALLPK